MTNGASDVTAERVARNDARFRASNEELAAVADALELDEGQLLPFLCECSDVGCTAILQLTRAEYEAVRRDATRFITEAGHADRANGWARAVEEHDRYTIEEKVGEAAEIAASLDPRAEETR